MWDRADQAVMCSFGPLFPIAQYTLAVSLPVSPCQSLLTEVENALNPSGMLHCHCARYLCPHLPAIAQSHFSNFCD